MSGDRPVSKGQPGPRPSRKSWAAAALFGLCPLCGAKTLFEGLTGFAPKCGACDLDYGRFNVGDGPAAFLTMIIGALVVALALWAEFTFSPPLWLHVVVWLPLIVLATTGGLRVSKAALLAAEFQRRAREATGADIRKD